MDRWRAEVMNIKEDVLKSILKTEIQIYGWSTLQKAYHPDNNIDFPMAHELYDFVKQVYDSMRGKV